MIVAVNAIYAIAKRSLKKKIRTSTGFEPLFLACYVITVLCNLEESQSQSKPKLPTTFKTDDAYHSFLS